MIPMTADEQPIVLHAAEWHQITGYGWVAYFPNHERQNPRHLTGKEVIVTGRYHVTGVETFAVMDGHPALLRPYGLLLKFAGPAAPDQLAGALNAEDWFVVKGRGWMATFPNTEKENPRHMGGGEVTVIGRYRVQAVETHAVPDDHPAVLREYGLTLEFIGPVAPDQVEVVR